MMPMRKVFFWISLSLTIICLIAGFESGGNWQGAAWSMLLGLFWFWAWREPTTLLPTLCLIVSIILAAAGILEGIQPWLMICGSAAALAAWDSLLLVSALQNASSRDKTQAYETAHLKYLLMAVGGGIIISLSGLLLSFQFPFLIIMLLTGGLVFLLERVWGAIKKRNPEV